MIIIILFLLGILFVILSVVFYKSSKMPVEGDIVEGIVTGSTKFPGDRTNARAVAEYWYENQKYEWVASVAQNPIPEHLKKGKSIELIVNPSNPSHATLKNGIKPANILWIVFMVFAVISFLLMAILFIFV